MTMIAILADYLLFISCLFILLGSVFISFKMRFIQLRLIPSLIKMLFCSNKESQEESQTISPRRALFTAMSTTLGIGTIVGPIIAIHLGGPGALLGFILTAFFGSAATFTEVNLSIRFRKKLSSGEIMGGPMQYLQQIFSPASAKWYAICCFILMTAWSGAQANQLVAILDSPLLGAFRVPTFISAALLSILVVLTLMGGIKRIGAFSAKLVPVMFILYLGSSFWIIFANTDKLWEILVTIFYSAFSPYAMASGALVGGIMNALRWGIFKGTQATEAGVGTQTIPHSMADTKDPIAQGTLAMLSTYSAGFLAFLSGIIALITGSWQNPELPLGISMVAASYQEYFTVFGIVIVSIITALFGFGTILGNSYNGSRCFGYLTENKWIKSYYIGSAFIIFFGAIAEVKTIWSLVDLILVGMVIPHMSALMLFAHRESDKILGEEHPVEEQISFVA